MKLKRERILVKSVGRINATGNNKCLFKEMCFKKIFEFLVKIGSKRMVYKNKDFESKIFNLPKYSFIKALLFTPLAHLHINKNMPNYHMLPNQQVNKNSAKMSQTGNWPLFEQSRVCPYD